MDERFKGVFKGGEGGSEVVKELVEEKEESKQIRTKMLKTCAEFFPWEVEESELESER
ncbi:MAG: hypothetical protein I3273_01555 [Candidatus Moeniiplasma glomeromycotorum]|nr:hypothetical protein [Candidatus Moeniiplasma glomeromycotorum]MCE8168796.1 hypothetical protein [Candidatus Moeniiplasma glomeromycotorum]